MHNLFLDFIGSNKQLIQAHGLKIFETKKIHGMIRAFDILACVIIPTLNEEGELTKFLDSVRRQKTFYPVAVIVSDNGSVDKTVELANTYGANITFEKTKGIGPARQKGLELIKSIPNINQEKVVVIQTDSDSVLTNENYIHSVCQVYERDQYIQVSVGPTNFPVITEGGTLDYITNAKDFKACFGTLSLKELFVKCGRNIDDYLLSPPYRLLPGANSTYRLSIFDKFGISYPKDKSWESIILSVKLQQKIKSSQIAYVDDQIITTSNRAYANSDGITTAETLKKIKRQRYIKPSKSKDSISPVNTLKSVIANIDRVTYSLSTHEHVAKIIIRYPKVVKPNQRVVKAVNASTGKIVPNRFVVIEHDNKQYLHEANIIAKRDLEIYKRLKTKLAEKGMLVLLDSGYCVEVATGNLITRKHDDLDLVVVCPSDIGTEDVENYLLNELNRGSEDEWTTNETKEGWVWFTKKGIGKKEQINLHVLRGKQHYNLLKINTQTNNIYSIKTEDSELVLENDKRYSVAHMDINEILASKIRLIESYGNKPRQKDIYDIKRMIKSSKFSKKECIAILSRFYKSKSYLDDKRAQSKALSVYRYAVSLKHP